MQLPRANAQVIFRRVGDGAVLLSMANEVYYGLNAVGARIWELLPPNSATFGDLFAALASEYRDVSRDMLERDTRELLEQLAEQGLVLVPDSDANHAPEVD